MSDAANNRRSLTGFMILAVQQLWFAAAGLLIAAALGWVKFW